VSTTLYFIAGKAGSGKTTLARQLGRSIPAVVICEDEWLSCLGDPIEDLEDYLAAAAKVRRLVESLTKQLLAMHMPVVFDFAGNTPRDRAWVRSIFVAAGAGHVLYYIQADDATCKAGVARRNAERPDGVFFGEVSEAQIDEVNRYFVPPADSEGFHVVVRGR
jgi:predicted kinase